VDSVVQDLKSETEEREIEWRIGSLSTVKCDPGLLRQMFANLLSNAVKYTRLRGRAVIEVGESTIEGKTVFLFATTARDLIPSMRTSSLEHFNGCTPTWSLKAPA
jgi:signal transduction histidine kinase